MHPADLVAGLEASLLASASQRRAYTSIYRGMSKLQRLVGSPSRDQIHRMISVKPMQIEFLTVKTFVAISDFFSIL